MNHYNRAKSRVAPGDVAFPATYDAQSGASSFDNSAALSCSNVSCHGGQATPNWQDRHDRREHPVHELPHVRHDAQFNSYNFGQPRTSSDHQVTCTICHNTTTLAVNHFTNLATPAMEGPASATIGGAGTAITTWDHRATRSCTPTCHGVQTW